MKPALQTPDIELGELLRGDLLYGQYQATERGGAMPLLVTIGGASAGGVDELAANFTACSEWVWTGQADFEGSPLTAVAERVPAGRPSTELEPDELGVATVAALAISAAAALTDVAARKLPTLGLAPELIYFDARQDDPPERARIAIRAPLALPQLKRPDYGVPPLYRWSYVAPELAGAELEPLTVAGVSFNVAVLIAGWLGKAHPFAADTLVEHLTRLHQGRPVLEGIPAGLESPLASALSPAPKNRPTVEELIQSLPAPHG